MRERAFRAVTRFVAGGIELDTEARRVRRGGRIIHLGPTEFRVLEVLIQNPGRIFSRAQLRTVAWRRDAAVRERTVDVCISRLRNALNRGGISGPIETVRGMGYLFRGK